uniref:F-box domain-containing protein n=1 Tax=Aegilops tauschii TaxID=37682 RepID=M8BPG0_AEGTA
MAIAGGRSPVECPPAYANYDCRSSRKKIIIATSKHKIDNKYEKKVFEETLTPVHKTDEEIALSSTQAKATREILLHLPAKSAIHSKLVCKQWLRLIENENFTESYFKHKNIDRRPKVMLVGKGTGQLGFSFAPLNGCLRGTPSHSRLLDTKVVCSKPCHGLNLVSTKTKDYICNPCTGFFWCYSTWGQLWPYTGECLKQKSMLLPSATRMLA